MLILSYRRILNIIWLFSKLYHVPVHSFDVLTLQHYHVWNPLILCYIPDFYFDRIYIFIPKLKFLFSISVHFTSNTRIDICRNGILRWCRSLFYSENVVNWMKNWYWVNESPCFRRTQPVHFAFRKCIISDIRRG